MRFHKGRFSRRARRNLGLVAGSGVIAYLVILNIAQGTPVLAIFLIVLVGLLTLVGAMLVSNLIWKGPEE